jgi:hypothetical protein
MIISHKHKFIFVKTAKTAGTSIEVFLDQYCGEEDILTPFAFPEENHRPRNYKGLFNPFPTIKQKFGTDSLSWVELGSVLKNFLTFQRFYHHIPAYKIRRRVEEEVWNNYYKFTVERNPWEKVISGWFYYRNSYNKDVTLNEYLKFCKRRIKRRGRGTGVCPYNYPNYTDPKTGEILVDRIILYEELGEGLSEVLEEIGISPETNLDIYAKKGSEREKYTEYYTREQKEFVRDMFVKEIELHGYTFGG